MGYQRTKHIIAISIDNHSALSFGWRVESVDISGDRSVGHSDAGAIAHRIVTLGDHSAVGHFHHMANSLKHEKVSRIHA